MEGTLEKEINMKHILITFFLMLLLLASFISTYNAPKASANNTSATTKCVNIPATPDYLSSGLLSDALAAITYARSLEHLRALHLPTNFASLDVAHQQFVLINLERTDRGLKALSWDNNLAAMAINYSKQMRDLKFFSHTSPISGSFEKRIGSNPEIAGHFSDVAENLAGNPVASAGAIYEYMYDDVAESCGHRDTILNKKLTMVGIGEVGGGTYGSMSAQEFLPSAPWNPYKG
jgi:uncharacterized protein YkwD